MKKYLLPLLAALLLMLNLSGISASAGEFQLFDPGYLLSSSESSEVAERLQQTADTINMNVVVILGNEQNSDTTIESMTNSTYDQLYTNQSDGVCLYLDLSSSASPYDYLSTTGLAQFYYTNSERNNRIDPMLSAVGKHLYPKGSEDVVGALDEFANQLETYYSRGIPENYYIYDNVYHEYYHVENNQIIATSGKPYLDMVRLVTGTLCGLILGVLAAAITKLSVKSKYKFIHELSPTNYLNKKSVRYTEQSDRFLRERVTKTQIVRDTGGGGSHHSSGGGHSSGGHGGGGHHR